jgi:hypothetical protein
MNSLYGHNSIIDNRIFARLSPVQILPTFRSVLLGKKSRQEKRAFRNMQSQRESGPMRDIWEPQNDYEKINPEKVPRLKKNARFFIELKTKANCSAKVHAVPLSGEREQICLQTSKSEKMIYGIMMSHDMDWDK